MKVENKEQYPFGPLIVRVDGQSYRADIDQKPLLYGYPLVVFDDLFGSPGRTIKEEIIRQGAIEETLADGANPGRDIVFPLASSDPALIGIIKDWMRGDLPLGDVDVEKYK